MTTCSRHNIALTTLMLGLMASPASQARIASEGFYAGVFAGPAYMTKIKSESIIPTLTMEDPTCSGLACFYSEVTARLPASALANGFPNYDQYILEIGYQGGAVLGYKYYDYRLELEGVWNSLDNQRLSVPGDPKSLPTQAGLDPVSLRQGISGTTQLEAGMLNLYYDFDTHALNSDTDEDFVPFIGVGIGRGQIKRRIKLCDPQLLLALNDTRNAYQVIIGSQYSPDKWTTYSIDYRYFSTTDATWNSLWHHNANSNTSTVLFGKEYATSSINLTLTYHFADETMLIV